MKKLAMLVASLLVLMAVTGCGSSSKPVQTQPVVVETPSPIQFNGTGQKFNKFALLKGLSVFKINASGKGEFEADLLDSSGKTVTVLTKEDSVANSSFAQGIAVAGTYAVVVKTDAQNKWDITIEQPRDLKASVIKTFKGENSQASQVFGLKQGLNGFNMKYTGKGTFKATLFDREGNIVTSLVDTRKADHLGNYSGVVPVSIPNDGLFILNVVSSDGGWSVDIE